MQDKVMEKKAFLSYAKVKFYKTFDMAIVPYKINEKQEQPGSQLSIQLIRPGCQAFLFF